MQECFENRPLNGYLSLYVGPKYCYTFVFPHLHLGELLTAYKCLKPKIDPPYSTVYTVQCTVYPRYKLSTHTPRTISFSILPTGALHDVVFFTE